MYFAHGQNVQFKIQLFDMHGLSAGLHKSVIVQLDLNPKLFAEKGKVWKITPPFADTKVLIHNSTLKTFSQQEVKADYLYRVFIRDDGGTMHRQSKDERVRVFVQDKYVEHRVSERLGKLGFKCTPIGGNGKPDILATHSALPSQQLDVEVNHSPDKYTLSKFATDLEKFQRFGETHTLTRLLIVHCGAYVERGVLQHPDIKKSNISIISFRALAELVSAHESGTMAQEKALLVLTQSGDIGFRQPGPRPFDPIPDPRVIKLEHYFAKKRFAPVGTPGRPRFAEINSLHQLPVQLLPRVLDVASEHGSTYKSLLGLARKIDTEIAVISGPGINSSTGSARALQALGLVDAKGQLTEDGSQIVVLNKTRNRKLLEGRVAFHFLSITGAADILALAANLCKTNRPQNKNDFLRLLSLACGEKEIAKNGRAERTCRAVLTWAEQLHLAPGWDGRARTYRVDMKRIERILSSGGNS